MKLEGFDVDYTFFTAQQLNRYIAMAVTLDFAID